MIGQLRFDLMEGGDDLLQIVASDWPTANRLLIDLLFSLLPSVNSDRRAQLLTQVLPRLAVTPTSRAHARRALFALLANMSNPWIAWELAEAVAGLDPTAEDRAQARQTLLRLATSEAGTTPRLAKAVASLAPTPQECIQASEKRSSRCSPAKPIPRGRYGSRRRSPGLAQLRRIEHTPEKHCSGCLLAPAIHGTPTSWQRP